MGIDWEEILDAEGEDMADAYEDSLPEEEPDWCENLDNSNENNKENKEKPLKKEEVEILEFPEDELDEENLKLFDWK